VKSLLELGIVGVFLGIAYRYCKDWSLEVKGGGKFGKK
jgi:hypothetical protein